MALIMRSGKHPWFPLREMDKFLDEDSLKQSSTPMVYRVCRGNHEFLKYPRMTKGCFHYGTVGHAIIQ